MQLLKILQWYFSKWNSRSNYILNSVIIRCCILSYFFLIPCILLISIILTVNKAFSAISCDCHIRGIDQGTFVAGLTFWCTRVSEFYLSLSSSISDSLSASQSSSQSVGSSKSPIQLSHLSVCEMCSGELCSLRSAGWWSIHLNPYTFKVSVRSLSSISNCSGLSLRVRFRVQTEPLPNWQSWLRMNPKCQLGYGSIVISQPIPIRPVVSWSPSRPNLSFS